jgi:hypothetical protein
LRRWKDAQRNEPAGTIAVIGDLHGSWDDWDVAWFNASDYGCSSSRAISAAARSWGRQDRALDRTAGEAGARDASNNDVAYQPAIAAGSRTSAG